MTGVMVEIPDERGGWSAARVCGVSGMHLVVIIRSADGRLSLRVVSPSDCRDSDAAWQLVQSATGGLYREDGSRIW